MSKKDPRTTNGSVRRRIKAIWRSRGEPFALCGRPIDYSLGMVVNPLTGKRRPHPMSFVVDEILPVSLGGSPTELANTQPAHWICNARKGDGIWWLHHRDVPIGATMSRRRRHQARPSRRS